jgi:transcriptional regulator with XRE-family HTH domain
MNNTPSRRAREAAGLTLAQVARTTKRSKDALRQYESKNLFPFHLAIALSKIYQCSFDVFLPYRQST